MRNVRLSRISEECEKCPSVPICIPICIRFASETNVGTGTSGDLDVPPGICVGFIAMFVFVGFMLSNIGGGAKWKGQSGSIRWSVGSLMRDRLANMGQTDISHILR